MSDGERDTTPTVAGLLADPVTSRALRDVLLAWSMRDPVDAANDAECLAKGPVPAIGGETDMHVLNAELRERAGPQARDADDRLLAWSRVEAVTGVSRTTVWRLERVGAFPARVQVSPGRVGWWESEVTAWKRSRGPAVLPRPGTGQKAKLTDVACVGRKTDSGGQGPIPPRGRMVDRVGAPPERPARSRRGRPVSPDQMGFDF